MSRLQRAVAKAEQEGLLTWTGREDFGRTEARREPDREPRVAPRDEPIWREGGVDEDSVNGISTLSPLFVAATHPTSAAVRSSSSSPAPARVMERPPPAPTSR
jgi:hypothetical protein